MRAMYLAGVQPNCRILLASLIVEWNSDDLQMHNILDRMIIPGFHSLVEMFRTFELR